MKHRLITALALIPCVAIAAGFDCAKSSIPIEKLVCSDRQLSDLDDKLAAAYARARSGEPNRLDIVEEQKLWLKKERASCKDIACLKASYSQRIAELKEWDPEPLPKELKDAGIHRNMLYAAAKKILVAKGWHIEPPDTNSQSPYSQFPEISCGEGWHAICSAGISKGSVSYGVIVREAKQGLVVDGTY